MRVCAVTCEVVGANGIDKYRSSAACEQIIKHAATVSHYHIVARGSCAYKQNTTQLSQQVYITVVPSKGLASYWARLPQVSRKLHAHFSFDLVTAENPFMAGVAGLLAARVNRIPLGVEIHGELLDNAAYASTRKGGAFVNALGHWIVKRANAIRVVSRPQYQRLLDGGCKPEKVVFAPCAVDLERFCPAVQECNRGESESGVLFAGRLERQKNPVALIEIARELKGQESAIRIWVCGDGSYRDRLERLARHECLPIDFLGNVSSEEICNRLQRCLCVVLPSLFEGTPRIILEAFAVGRPCIASSIPENCAVISDGKDGFCIPHDRPDLFAARIIELRRRPDEAIRVGEAARRTAEKYSLESVRPKYSEYYRRTIALYRGAQNTS